MGPADRTALRALFDGPRPTTEIEPLSTIARTKLHKRLKARRPCVSYNVEWGKIWQVRYVKTKQENVPRNER